MHTLDDLNEFADGALKERMSLAWDEVIDSLTDPNVESKAARKITVTITVKPNGERNFASVAVVTKTTLPPANPIETALTIGTANGKPAVREYHATQGSLV